jgi:hypothetical protein
MKEGAKPEKVQNKQCHKRNVTPVITLKIFKKFKIYPLPSENHHDILNV